MRLSYRESVPDYRHWRKRVDGTLCKDTGYTACLLMLQNVAILFHGGYN